MSIETDKDLLGLLKFKALKGFKEFGYPTTEPYMTRMEHELKIIEQTGFVPYFLLVGDICAFMRREKIRFAARGSGCGSVVVWGLGISHRWLDPVRYEIPFERFLNPDRVSNPDVDMDIDDQRRHEVVKYTIDKYGKDRVARIVNFGTLGAKSAIIDFARALQIPNYQEVSAEISAAIPGGKGADGKNHRLSDLIKANEFLQEKQKQFSELFTLAIKAEGKVRQAGIHAAGTIIAPGPLTDYLPLFFQGSPENREEADWFPATQWDMYDCEKRGLVKMDYLGLKTLRVIDQAQSIVNAVRQYRGETEVFSIDHVSQQDDVTWKLLGDGKLLGIFQVERTFIQNFARRMNLQNVKDLWQLAVLVAIIRPGMMDAGMTEVYLRRASGQEEPIAPHPSLTKRLTKTYGCLVFQEELMAVTEIMAGYTKSRADQIRAIVSKKKVEEMMKEKPAFIKAGMDTQKATEEEVTKVWDLIETFGRYGFCLGHAAAYGIIAYQTAYLKANYPLCYMTPLINSEAGKSDADAGYNCGVAVYVEEAKAMGLKVLSPSVLYSSAYCTIVHPFTDEIRFGLLLIKKVSSGAVEWITKNCRNTTTLKEFILACFERRLVPKMKKDPETGQSVETGQTEWRTYNMVGKSDLEGLAAAGALDCFDSYRPRIKTMLEKLSELAKKYHEQQCKVDNGSKKLKNPPEHFLQEIQDYVLEDDHVKQESLEDILRLEREATGCYLSESPFTPFAEQIREYATCTPLEIKDQTVPDGVPWHFVAILSDLKETVIKNGKNKGKPMAIMTFRGIGGDIEAPAFANVWEKLAGMPGLIERFAIYIVHVKPDFKGAGFIVENMWRLSKQLGQ